MIRTITLENFMSHGKTVIELADGLTVLTGPNNCGKSALVAALQILAANGRTKHVMRHGAKVCTVTVETDDDQTIVWERKKSTVKYNINGEDVHRIGQGVPESLHESLRLSKVVTETGASKNEYDIHFGEQKSPVFLLNESGTRAAAFFASGSDAAKLVEMQHLHRTRTTTKRAEAKRLVAESKANVARIAAFAPIEAISESVKTAEQLGAKIDKLHEKAQKIKAMILQLGVAGCEVTRRHSELRVLRKLDNAKTTPDKLRDRAVRCEALRDWLVKAAKLMRLRGSEASRVDALALLLPCPVQHPADTLKRLIEQIENTQVRRDCVMQLSRGCALLAPPPAMQPVDACRRVYKKLVAAIECQAAANESNKTLGVLRAPPHSHDTGGLAKAIEGLSAAVEKQALVDAKWAVIRSLETPPVIEATKPLELVIGRLLEAQCQSDRFDHRVLLLKGLQPIETPGDPKPIKMVLEQLGTLAGELTRAQGKVEEASVLVQENERDITEFVSVHPKCVTCGGRIDPATLMSTLPGTHEHIVEDRIVEEQRPEATDD